MKKSTINSVKSHQVKKSEEDVKQLILNKVNKPLSEKFTDENFDEYNQKETILDMVNKMPYRKFLAKGITVYGKKIRPEFYNQLFRLTGLKRNPHHPNWKPRIFAKHTLTALYRRFPDGIIKYLQENNGADVYGFRMHKHFQLLNKLGEAKLLSVIEDAIRVMKTANNWSHFLRLYAIEFGLTYQATLFED